MGYLLFSWSRDREKMFLIKGINGQRGLASPTPLLMGWFLIDLRNNWQYVAQSNMIDIDGRKEKERRPLSKKVDQEVLESYWGREKLL